MKIEDAFFAKDWGLAILPLISIMYGLACLASAVILVFLYVLVTIESVLMLSMSWARKHGRVNSV